MIKNWEGKLRARNVMLLNFNAVTGASGGKYEL
jgi:hypothetical protein